MIVQDWYTHSVFSNCQWASSILLVSLPLRYSCMFEVHILVCKHELHAPELNPTFAKPQRVLNKRMKREREREREAKCQKKEMIKGSYISLLFCDVCVCVCAPFFENTGEREAHLFSQKWWTEFCLLLTGFESLVHSHNVWNHSRNVFLSLFVDLAGSCEE